MAVIAIIVCIFVCLGFFAILVGVVNLLSGSRRHSSLKPKHTILNPIRERFGAENLRPNRLGELNVFRPALVFDYGRTMARLKHYGKPWNRANQSTVLETSFDLSSGQQVSIVSRDASTVQHWFGSGQDLLDFTQCALELFDQMMLHKAEGVEFLHQNQAAVIEDFRCPICSDDVMHEMVVCRRCKTPHCAECWEYNGKCATFACMEERCIRVEEQEL